MSFRVLWVHYDKATQNAIKVHDEFKFEETIYADWFSESNEEKFKDFRVKL